MAQLHVIGQPMMFVDEKAASPSTKKVLNSRLDTQQQTQPRRKFNPRKVTLSVVITAPRRTVVLKRRLLPPLTFRVRSSVAPLFLVRLFVASQDIASCARQMGDGWWVQAIFSLSS